MYLTAFFGALVFPGLGQALTGRIWRGLFWLTLVWAAIICSVSAIMLRAPVMLVVIAVAVNMTVGLAAIADAVVCARRPRRYWGRWWTRGLTVLALMLDVPQFLVNHFFEAFVMPTNAMLPAVVGPNLAGTCTACGGDVVLAPQNSTPPDSSIDSFARVVGVCQPCGALLDEAAYADKDARPRSGDRFLVNKWLAPHRWDIIVFNCPDDPGEVYAKRVVGLPGERVELVDGEVTIDGKIAPKPEHLRYLRYVNRPVEHGWHGWGQTGQPVALAEDEFFVLRDFAPRARDSRQWEPNATGHPPYA
jgi:signal peptidase I